MATSGSARVTLRDVARRAGVSTSTVSNVMNEYPFLRPETRARVLDAVAATGYRPSRAGQVLRSGRSNLVPLAIPDLRSPYFAQLAHHVGEAARRRGFVPLTIETGALRDRELVAAEGYTDTVVSGVLLFGVAAEAADMRAAGGRTPVITLGRPVDEPWSDHLVLPFDDTAEALVAHLVGRGRRRIAYAGLQTDGAATISALHLRALRAALERRGLQLPAASVLELEGLGREHGGAVAGRLLALGLGTEDGPDALLTANGPLAVGALRGLQREGLAVPEQLAVAAWGGAPECAFTCPSITAVDQDHAAVASLVYDALEARLADPDRAPTVQAMPWTLSVRESTA